MTADRALSSLTPCVIGRRQGGCHPNEGSSIVQGIMRQTTNSVLDPSSSIRPSRPPVRLSSPGPHAITRTHTGDWACRAKLPLLHVPHLGRPLLVPTASHPHHIQPTTVPVSPSIERRCLLLHDRNPGNSIQMPINGTSTHHSSLNGADFAPLTQRDRSIRPPCDR